MELFYHLLSLSRSSSDLYMHIFFSGSPIASNRN